MAGAFNGEVDGIAGLMEHPDLVLKTLAGIGYAVDGHDAIPGPHAGLFGGAARSDLLDALVVAGGFVIGVETEFDSRRRPGPGRGRPRDRIHEQRNGKDRRSRG